MAQSLADKTAQVKARQIRKATESKLLVEFGIEVMPSGCNWVFQTVKDGLKLEGIAAIESDDFGRCLAVKDAEQETHYTVDVNQVKFYMDLNDPTMPGSYYVIK